MPKKLPEDLNERIETEIARHPDGVGIDDLHAVLADVVSRRSLQRRLQYLAEQKKVFPVGKGRSMRYRHPEVIAVQVREQVRATDDVGAETYDKVSPEGEEIRRHIRQPRQQRAPVSYRQSFLEQYTPNHTSYLPETLRAQLHGLGRSPIENAPAGRLPATSSSGTRERGDQSKNPPLLRLAHHFLSRNANLPIW